VFLKIQKNQDTKSPNAKTKVSLIYTPTYTPRVDTKTTTDPKVDPLRTSEQLLKDSVYKEKKMIFLMNKNYKLLFYYLKSMEKRRICTRPYINSIQKLPLNNIMIPIKYIIKTLIEKTAACLPLIPSFSRDSRKTTTKKIVNLNKFL